MSRRNAMFHARQAPGDEGFAMVVSVVLATVAIMLVTVVLAMGVHLDGATTRERRWQLALQVAESGVEEAVTRLRSDPGFGVTPVSATVPGGEYQVKVTPLATGAGVQIDSIGFTPSSTATSRLQRRLRVTYQPEPTFQYALFSNTGLSIGAGSGDTCDETQAPTDPSARKCVIGDVFANDDLVLENTAEVVGNVISAEGTVELKNNAAIRANVVTGEGGNVRTGGNRNDSGWFALRIGNADVTGNADIRVADAACTDQNRYNVDNANRVGGTVTLPPGATATGATRVDACNVRTDTTPLPTYEYDPSNYNAAKTTTAAAFNAFSGDLNNFGGSPTDALYVTGAANEYVSLKDKFVTDDFALITETKLEQPNSGSDFFPSAAGLADDIIQIISLSSHTSGGFTIDVENHFDVPLPGSPAVLVYTPGSCSFKNTFLDNGAVYCGTLDISQGLAITYDPRIERLVGFGTAKFVRSSFRELAPSTAL